MEMVLRLPKNYVDVADDEMEYVEGSATSEQLYNASRAFLAIVMVGVGLAVAACGFCGAFVTAGVSSVAAVAGVAIALKGVETIVKMCVGR